MAACSEMGVEALRMADTPAGRRAYFDFTRPVALCIGGGAGAQVCPTGAIHIEDRDGVRRTIITGNRRARTAAATWSECGAPTQTPVTGSSSGSACRITWRPFSIREVCPSCACCGPIVQEDDLRMSTNLQPGSAFPIWRNADVGWCELQRLRRQSRRRRAALVRRRRRPAAGAGVPA